MPFEMHKICEEQAKKKSAKYLLQFSVLGAQRVYAQTSFYQENLAFCFQLCTVTHFVGFLPLPWFSCSLVFFPYS
jgi:hypothetical protein